MVLLGKVLPVEKLKDVNQELYSICLKDSKLVSILHIVVIVFVHGNGNCNCCKD